MSARHFIHDPTHAVLSSLESLTLTNPSLLFDETNKIVYRHSSSLSSTQNVSLVCGGGSGHEPGFSAFVGHGLLSACVCGTIFASPSADQIRNCLLQKLPPDSQGTLVIVANYTGDVLNFGMAVEKARAMCKKVAMVVVGDDVGVGRTKGGKVGRRGLSGQAFVIKICRALAEAGVDLGTCARVGELVAENLVSIGASLSRVHVPGKATKEAKDEEERLEFGMVEIGMGVHNEPGCEKTRADLPGLVQKMLAQMLDIRDTDRAYLKVERSDQTVLIFNNFGGVSNLELGAIIPEVIAQLEKEYGVKPRRVIAGTFYGSLNGPGFGLSLLKLADTGLGPGKSMLELLDAPTQATGWSANIKMETWEKTYVKTQEKGQVVERDIKSSNLRIDPKVLDKALRSGLGRIIAAESDITSYDSIVGDGDCGVGLKRGAEAILKLLDAQTVSEDVFVSLERIVQIVETTLDGTSGALYTIFLNSLTHNLRTQDNSSETSLTPAIWAKALSLSLEALSKYTPAQPGDRTLIDALYPFVEVLQATGSMKQAVLAAKKGADETKGMQARLGRSVYVGGEGYKKVPDPGAYGLSEFLIGIADGL